MARRDEDDARSEFHRMLDAGALETGDVLQYRRDEVPQRVLRRLGRGEYSAQDELDLHHADLAQAEALLRAFLRSEEHTSELQSLMRISNAVFCLKKKKLLSLYLLKQNTHSETNPAHNLTLILSY